MLVSRRDTTRPFSSAGIRCSRFKRARTVLQGRVIHMSEKG